MEITVEINPPKTKGCQHIPVTYTLDGRVIRKVYLAEDLKELALEDIIPALEQTVAQEVLSQKSADSKAGIKPTMKAVSI